MVRRDGERGMNDLITPLEGVRIEHLPYLMNYKKTQALPQGLPKFDLMMYLELIAATERDGPRG